MLNITWALLFCKAGLKRGVNKAALQTMKEQQYYVYFITRHQS